LAKEIDSVLYLIYMFTKLEVMMMMMMMMGEIIIAWLGGR
jgi:hypothetical protein